MISYERFRKEVMNRIKSYLPENYAGWKVRMETEYKVNQTLDCLTLIPPEKRKLTAVPKFYMQEYYKVFQNGTSADFILRMIASKIVNAPSPEEVEKSGFDILRFQDDVVVQLVQQHLRISHFSSLPSLAFLADHQLAGPLDHASACSCTPLAAAAAPRRAACTACRLGLLPR